MVLKKRVKLLYIRYHMLPKNKLELWKNKPTKVKEEKKILRNKPKNDFFLLSNNLIISKIYIIIIKLNFNLMSKISN